MTDTNLTYSTGTVSVSASGTVVTAGGSPLPIWSSNARQWDFISIDGSALVPITSVTDDTHLDIPAWTGATKSAVNYVIYQLSPIRFVGGQDSATVSKLVAYLNGTGYIYPVPGDVPDPSLGDENQYALKTNTGTWKLWLKTGGLWVLQGIPVGTNYTGAWSSTATYNANDVVTRNGSAYISKTTNTNKAPESNSSDWDILAQAGTNGISWSSGSTVPTGGNSGDYYLRTTTDDVYKNTAGTWAIIANIKGDRGATWTSGTGVPSGGVDGDLYIRTTSSDVYKNTSGTWAVLTNIRGNDGGGVTIPFTFDGTSQSSSDPGSGKARLNQVTQNTSTALIVSATDNRGIDFTAALDSLSSGSSAVKQILRVYKATDQTKFIIFTVASVNTGTGFRAVNCTPIASSASIPFTNADPLVATFVPVGDKGDSITGPQGASYRERVYDAGTTYVNNTTFIDRAILNGQTWTCIVASVVGVSPDSDATKWALAARGVDPSVIAAATAARDQAQAAQTATATIQTAVEADAATVSSDKTAASGYADAASTSATTAASTATTVEGLIASALAIAAQGADDWDADDGTGTDATVDDGDADI